MTAPTGPALDLQREWETLQAKQTKEQRLAAADAFCDLLATAAADPNPLSLGELRSLMYVAQGLGRVKS